MWKALTSSSQGQGHRRGEGLRLLPRRSCYVMHVTTTSTTCIAPCSSKVQRWACACRAAMVRWSMLRPRLLENLTCKYGGVLMLASRLCLTG